MDNPDKILFSEKQYLGHNRLSMVIRTMLAIFCFAGYYWSENPKPVHFVFMDIGRYPMDEMAGSGLIFFVMGMVILILGVALTYVLHIQTTVYDDYMVLDGFWTSRRVKIDFSSITKIRTGRYKKNLWRRAVYNLHNNGIIRFYTSGEDFVELTDKSGFIYRIGTQKPHELTNVLKGPLSSTKR